MTQKRYISEQVQKNLKMKMVFVGGPRQVGKTTMAKSLLKKGGLYLNWDLSAHRDRILKEELPVEGLLVLDEVHKYRRWRGLLKGWFDAHRDDLQFLITGSAQLDVYRFGGDSLQGRYFFHRLHPLSVAELGMTQQKEIFDLFQLSGFPEPFFSGSEKDARRWSREYRQRLVQDDIRTLENISDLSTMELLLARLPDLVGSPLSINSLREDLQKDHSTIARYLKILEKVYGFFRLSPYGPPKVRAVKKEQKHYHFDWTLVSDPGLRFENMVACHLLKWCHFMEDSEGIQHELRYFRDVYKKEVDFCILKENKPVLFVECKLADAEIGEGLKQLKLRLPQVESWQIHLRGKKDYQSVDGIRVAPAIELLKKLI